ncbi:MAG: hypothetical protein KGV57_00515 [Fusobacterium sp.]|nr:hypothetical protein [Fusobacterium sp.]
MKRKLLSFTLCTLALTVAVNNTLVNAQTATNNLNKNLVISNYANGYTVNIGILFR